MTDFQQLMRQWSALAPYNAIHVLRVSGPPEIDRWRAALNTAVKPLRLVDAAVAESQLPIEEQIAAELNKPFAAGDLPLRAFIIRDEETSHCFGLTFDHWLADSRSIRALMQRVFWNYSNAAAPLPPLQLDTGEPVARGSLAQQVKAFFACAGNYLRHRRAFRVYLHDPLDFSSGFFLRQFPIGAIHNIRRAAKSHGGTVNDIFVAAAAQTLGDFTAAPRYAKQKRPLRRGRDRVAIATAVDLRQSRAEVFGFALGYFSVVVERPEARPLPQLIEEVAGSTTASKAAARALQIDLGFRIAKRMWNRMPHDYARAQLFRRSMPLLAGISNVNLTGSWADAAAAGDSPRLLDYIRVSPVGPLLPIVFTLTTIGDRLSLCATYRTTAFTHEQAQHLATDFMGRLCAAT